MQVVNGWIEAEAPPAMVQSDDCLQDDDFPGYGGRDEEGEDGFTFVYFPHGGTRPQWKVTLTAAEICGIARGNKTDLRVRVRVRE